MTILLALLLAQAAPHPCMADAKKLCPDVKPGQGRIGACFKEHKHQVSAECSARIAEFHEEAQSCEAEEEKLCPDAAPGPARSACVREHLDQLSAECRNFFLKMHERRGEMRGCRGDAQKFCKGVKPGEGRILQCLKSHQGDLSPGCATEIR